nr:MAG TPA: hypothetical protein [Caudoviricetes sp.]
MKITVLKEGKFTMQLAEKTAYIKITNLHI